MIRRMTIVLLLITTVFISLVYGQIYKTGSYQYFFMMYNLSLSWIAYLLSLILLRVQQNKILLPIVGAAWFFFFPNAPYMITDFINLDWQLLIKSRHVAFVRVEFWYEFAFFTIGIWTSYLLGCVSLFRVQHLIREKFGMFWSWLASLGMLLLSGYGIFLGRFIRLNSWDVVARPFKVIDVVISTWTTETVMLASLFGCMMICTYVPLYVLMEGAIRRQ